MGAIPDISRMRGVHLQVPDNEANGRLGHARRVEIFFEIFGLALLFNIYHPQIIENIFEHFLFIFR